MLCDFQLKEEISYVMVTMMILVCSLQIHFDLPSLYSLYPGLRPGPSPVEVKWRWIGFWRALEWRAVCALSKLWISKDVCRGS